MSKKSDKTHLTGKRLVSKRHGRIAFRGMIDTLEAEFLEARILASSLGENYYDACFGEIVELLRKIMAAEVKGEALPAISLFGLPIDEIHRQTHDVQASFGLADHPLPDASMGPLAMRINYLRARVREGELLTIGVFGDFWRRRTDLIEAMNRLSSALWWLFCKTIT